MSVATFYRVLQFRWQSLSQYVWPRNREERNRAEINRLTDVLAHLYKRLLTRRKKIEVLRDRLAHLERCVAREQVPEMALIQAIERNRSRLVWNEERYQQQRHRFLHYKNLRKGLLRGHLEVCGDPPEEEIG